MTAEELIKEHEGYRGFVYLDSMNIPTGGYGHAFLNNSKLPRHIWDQIFIEDFAQAIRDYEKLGLNLDDVRRAAVIDLCFARGLTNMLKWSEFISYMRSGRWEDAAKYVENTVWYSRVAKRGPRICNLIREGKWEVL